VTNPRPQPIRQRRIMVSGIVVIEHLIHLALPRSVVPLVLVSLVSSGRLVGLLAGAGPLTFAVQTQAAPTLTDFWNGQATWVKDASSIGSNFGFHFVSFPPRDHGLWAYYINNYTELLRLGDTWYLYVRAPDGSGTGRFRPAGRPESAKP
jgi:hypothetical protein